MKLEHLLLLSPICKYDSYITLWQHTTQYQLRCACCVFYSDGRWTLISSDSLHTLMGVLNYFEPTYFQALVKYTETTAAQEVLQPYLFCQALIEGQTDKHISRVAIPNAS